MTPAPAEVLIVGAGVVGAGAAAILARAGRSVVVLDPGDGAESATRRSGGLVRAYEPDPLLRELAVRSHVRRWSGAGDSPARTFRRTGSLVLLGDGHLAEADRGVTELRAAGIAAELLDRGDLARRWPDLDTTGLAGAVWEPGGGYADPAAEAAGDLARAVRAGARRVRGTALRLAGEGVLTDGGVIGARVVVVAAGCHTPRLLPGLPPTRTRRIRYGFFSGGRGRLPTVVDLVTGMWGRPQVDGRFAGGYLTGVPAPEWDEEVDGGTHLTAGQADTIRREAGRRITWLPGAECLGGRYGTDLYHPAGPLLGMMPGIRNVVVAAAWSGGGFKTSPAAAERVAALCTARLDTGDH